MRELARRAGRDVKRVHEDVQVLTELGLVERTCRWFRSCRQCSGRSGTAGLGTGLRSMAPASGRLPAAASTMQHLVLCHQVPHAMKTLARHPTLRRAALLLAATAWATAAFAQALPTAPVRNVPEVFFGTTVDDPYRDFENIKSPPVAVSYTHLTLPTNREV